MSSHKLVHVSYTQLPHMLFFLLERSCLACWRAMLLLATMALARELLLKLHTTANLLETM
jgi:hypothetical protein